MEQTKNFVAMENSASRNALQILRYMLTGVLKNGSVVIIIISLPERVVLMVGIVPHIYGFMINSTIMVHDTIFYY